MYANIGNPHFIKISSEGLGLDGLQEKMMRNTVYFSGKVMEWGGGGYGEEKITEIVRNLTQSIERIRKVPEITEAPQKDNILPLFGIFLIANPSYQS